MKLCLFCRNPYKTLLPNCPHCGHSPLRINGIESFAPSMACGGGGFDERLYAQLVEIEPNHFWFRARNRLINWMLKQYAPGFESLLEIGCGTGFVLSGIAQEFPGRVMFGSEIFTAGLHYAAQRVPSATLMQMDARDIPFLEEFDVIGAFDVLEHIKEDVLVIEQMYCALKPGGIVILTVPQHQWLWSAFDDCARHERRYSKCELSRKVTDVGFKVLRDTSFVSILLPAMIISRVLNRKRAIDLDRSTEVTVNKNFNVLFGYLLEAELMGIKTGMSYPIGGSRLVVARKDSLVSADHRVLNTGSTK